MNYKLKYIGIGLLIAGLLFSLGERFTIPYIESSQNNETERLKNEINSLNKTITTLEDKIQKLNSDSEKQTNTSNTNNKSTSSNNNSKSNSDVVTGTVYIYEFVSLYEIGKQVEDLNIIENGRELELFLSKPEYSRSIQKGAFELSSDMTLEQMAKILTGKKQ